MEIIKLLIEKRTEGIRLAGRCVSAFLVLSLIYYLLGNMNTNFISLFVMISAAAVFLPVFISAFIKDRKHRKRTLQQTVFES